jgi:hypothetical protein
MWIIHWSSCNHRYILTIIFLFSYFYFPVFCFTIDYVTCFIWFVFNVLHTLSHKHYFTYTDSYSPLHIHILFHKLCFTYTVSHTLFHKHYCFNTNSHTLFHKHHCFNTLSHTLFHKHCLLPGGGLSLSSSAFVLQLLKDKNDMGTRHGKASFGEISLYYIYKDIYM